MAAGRGPPAKDTEWFGGVAVGPDGTFWGVTTFPDLTNLVRYDGSEWSRWPVMDTIWPADAEGMGGTGDAALGVAPDGSVWVAWSTGSWGSSRACNGGIGHFDGEAWTRYLQGLCVRTLDIAADGSVWVLAEDGDLYVITPK